MSSKNFYYVFKCKKEDCAVFEQFKSPIEAIDPITGDCILDNQKKYRYKCSRCQTLNTVDFKNVCNRGLMNLVYQLYMNRNMGYKDEKLYLK